jgi:AcrR family transcriptional regulator
VIIAVSLEGDASIMASATAEKPKAAQRIQSAAKELFYRQGIRATGVEEVCRVADATKMSLYRAYPSKDALVAAILAEDASGHDRWFEEVTAGATDAAGKLRALVSAKIEMLQDPAYRGCPMLLAQAEFPDPGHPTHRLVAEFKSRARGKVAALAREAGVADPELFADRLSLLIDGAWASLAYLGAERAGSAFRDAADILMRDVLPPAA